ncbi:MAG: GNAT family N-acetyltransferase [Muribaculaceae bacterium]
MNQLIGCCGIDCEKCDVRIATVNGDEALRAATARKWSQLNGIEIKPEYLYCLGCRTEGQKTYYCTNVCVIRRCAASQGYATCAECAKMMRCETVKPILNHQPDAESNLLEFGSDRLLLRPWHEADAEVLYHLAKDEDVGPRAGWAPHKSVDESLEIIRTVFHNPTTWAIVLRETGAVVGAIGYGESCECSLPARQGEMTVGYWVGKDYWNRGICTDALRLMIARVVNHTGIQSLISGHYVDNVASGRVMEKCGFVPTGEFCQSNTLQGSDGRSIRVLRWERE